jgi:tRNA-Thr(GGU) m(6)t(6)A37 methyltransferase TsaA
VTLEPIGYVSSPRTDQNLDDNWSSVTAAIALTDRFTPDALAGLDQFSHVEIVYLFNQVNPRDVLLTSRHPRSNPDWPKVGIFAQRAKMRPNRIGVTVCRLLGVDGVTLTVEALDAIDGTPVLDIKPYMAEFGARGEVHQPVWSHELMSTYWRH